MPCRARFWAAIEGRDDWDATRPLLPWLLGLLANRVRESRRQQQPGPRPCAARQGHRTESPRPRRARGVRDGVPRGAATHRRTVPDRARAASRARHRCPRARRGARCAGGTVRMRLHRGLDQLRQKLPQGFVAGGLAAAALSPEAFAAMRQVVLARVPGGAAVATGGRPALWWSARSRGSGCRRPRSLPSAAWSPSSVCHGLGGRATGRQARWRRCRLPASSPSCQQTGWSTRARRGLGRPRPNVATQRRQTRPAPCASCCATRATSKRSVTEPRCRCWNGCACSTRTR